ncbi:MAG: thiamine pyrophosphate-dependent dehydrogenase E1 component subunit alpha [Actinobacteria bacterium]|nr:thiamine pyrophosphate-dependent dehydrogenase E1 component subunit alpha [Actinomycetota bacterium]
MDELVRTGMDDGVRLRVFRTALTARRFEERITQLAHDGEVPSGLHLGAGQEVCQAAALAALRDDDPMLYGHRGTAYWIARGIQLDVILCDIACREGGTNRGKGGVMHVVDPGRGVLGESGTLGGNFVIGAGVAFAERYRGTEAVTIVFFGDGTSNRGQFHEAANFAGVQKLPLILFCENNGYGLSVSVTASTAVVNIADRAAGYGMPGVVVDGNDAEAVFAATAAAADRARAGEGPTLIEAKVNRIGGHWLADQERYRSDAEKSAVRSLDPLPLLRADVEARGLLDAAGIGSLEAEIGAAVDDAVAVMRSRDLVAPSTVLEGLFAP